MDNGRAYNATNGFVTVVVLNDGETFSDIHNCSICIVPVDQYLHVMASGGDAKGFIPVAEIGLNNITVSKEYL